MKRHTNNNSGKSRARLVNARAKRDFDLAASSAHRILNKGQILVNIIDIYQQDLISNMKMKSDPKNIGTIENEKLCSKLDERSAHDYASASLKDFDSDKETQSAYCLF